MEHLMIRAFAYITILLLAACTGETPASSVLRVAHSLDQSHTVHKALVFMNKRLQSYSNGSMQLKIYPDGQLGSEREAIELLQIGALAMTKVSASPLESFVPSMKVFSLPYVFRDREHYFAVLDSDIGKQLLLSPRSVLLRGLGYYDAGSRSFYSVAKPVVSPNDLKGMKIRVQQSQTAMALVQSLGGAPTPIAWGELYTALQQGVVDGAENNIPAYYRSRHYEVAPYLSLDQHTSVPDILLISERVWQDLSTQQQAWLQQAVDDSVVYQRQLWAADTQASLEQLRHAGVQIQRVDKGPYRQLTAELLSSDDSALASVLAAIAALGVR